MKVLFVSYNYRKWTEMLSGATNGRALLFSESGDRPEGHRISSDEGGSSPRNSSGKAVSDRKVFL